MGDGRAPQVMREKAISVTKTKNNPNKPGTSTVTKKTKREMKPYNSQTNLRSNQKLAQVAPATRRFSRNAGGKDDTQNIKEEAKTTTKEEATSKQTRRGRGSILKK